LYLEEGFSLGSLFLFGVLLDFAFFCSCGAFYSGFSGQSSYPGQVASFMHISPLSSVSFICYISLFLFLKNVRIYMARSRIGEKVFKMILTDGFCRDEVSYSLYKLLHINFLIIFTIFLSGRD